MNRKNKFLIVLGFIATIATVAYAAGFERISKDELIIGSGSTSSKTITLDVGLGAGNPKIKGNNSSPNLEFASDGVSFLPFGSGGGGGAAGVNVLTNGDFELGIANNWTASGGTTEDDESTNLINGTKTGCWTPTAASQTLTSDQEGVIQKIENGSCVAKFDYKLGDANVYAEVIDGSSNVLASRRLETSAESFEIPIPFKCPSSIDTVAFRLRSTASAAKICIDDIHVGTSERVRKTLELVSVDDPEATLNGGGLILSDKRVVKTYDGSGTNDSDFGRELTIDLDTILGGNPTDSTTYSLCIDKDTLGSAVTVSDTGEKVVPLEEANFKVLTDDLTDILAARYVCLAWIRSASTGTVWSGADSRFDDYIVKSDAPTPVAVNPIIFSQTQDIGTVGSVANDKGALVDGDFPTPANVHYYHLNGDSNDDSSNTAINLTQNGTPSFTSKGLFDREDVINFDGVDDYLSSTDTFFDFSNESITIGGTFEFVDWGGTSQYLIGKYNGTGNQRSYLMQLSAGSIAFLISHDGTTVSQINFDVSNLKGKHHLVGAFDSSGQFVQIYLDGQLAASTAASSANLFNSTATFGIGADASNVSSFMRGKAEDVFVYKGLLSESEINNLYSKRFSNNQQISGGHILTAESFPLSDLTGKVAFWNLNDVNDDSVNGLNLTNNGSVTFDGLDIFGQTGIANFNGTTQSLSSTDSFFTSDELTIAAWVKSDDDEGTIGGKYATAGDQRSYLFYFPNTSTVRCITSSTGTTIDSNLVTGFTPPIGEWFHAACVISRSSIKVFINGVKIGEVENNGIFTSTTPFALGNWESGTNQFTGKMQSYVFSKKALTDEDIRKLAASRIQHNVSTPTHLQEWFATYKGEFGTENQFGQDWLVDKTATDIYVDFGLNGGDEVTLNLKDLGTTPSILPLKKFNTFYSSDPCAGSECSIPHGLPGRPTSVEVWYEVNPEEFERQDPSTCQATQTNLVCVFSAITTIDATHRLNVIASMGDLSSAFEGDPVTTGAQTFSGNKEWTGTNKFTGGFDTTGNAGVATTNLKGLRHEYKMFQAYVSSTQGGVVDGTPTIVEFDTLETDINGNYDNTTNYRFQPDIAGIYRIAWAVRTAPGTANTLRHVDSTLYKNGVIARRGTEWNHTTTPYIHTFTSSGNVLIHANGTTDYFDIRGIGVLVGGTTVSFLSNGSYFNATLEKAD